MEEEEKRGIFHSAKRCALAALRAAVVLPSFWARKSLISRTKHAISTSAQAKSKQHSIHRLSWFVSALFTRVRYGQGQSKSQELDGRKHGERSDDDDQ